MGYYGELQGGELLKSNTNSYEKPVQAGWQCPICNRVYSPMTPMCYYCGDNQIVKTSTGTFISEK